MRQTSSPSPSCDELGSLENGERPDAWLCALTIQESATDCASTMATSAVSIPIWQESTSEGEPVAIAATAAVDEVRGSADASAITGVPATGDAWRHLHGRASNQGFLPISVEHYAMLLDWTGRELRADKRGSIPEHLAPMMERLGLNHANWVETVRGFGRLFKQAAGRSTALIDAAARCSRRWFQGQAAARAAFV